MENHNLLLKVSRLFPSSLISCQSSRTHVAESSIVIKKPHDDDEDHDHPSILQRRPKSDDIYSAVPDKSPRKTRNQRFSRSSDAEERKCPPVAPAAPTMRPKKVKTPSPSSNSGQWFSSGDEFEADPFFSQSSNSGDSLRLKTTTRRFVGKREEMKSIDESASCSFSSLASYNAVPSKCDAAKKAAAKGGDKKSSATCPEYELGSDHASTQMYYKDSSRRRKTAESRRKIRKSPSKGSFSDGSTIEEGFAVEKSSSDPHSDFMASMVEMIIEKQMFGAEDLDRLLFCFLSLNKADCHAVIYQVFSEICQTLFSD